MNFIIKYVLVLSCVFLAKTRGVSQKFSTDIKVGAENTSEYLSVLKGKKVAIVGNQSSRVGNSHLVDSLISLKIDVVKVFAPEHGFRGTADAGEKVEDGKDSKTGVPIVSLYGRKNRKPSTDKLKDVDVVVFDLQDVGVRFYTYISTMHYVMEACAEHGIPFIVLDRPNPNGHFVDGPILKEGNESFIGMHPVPIVHGMTIGEYAKMINGEKWLENGIEVKLTVIPCMNYDHTTFYELPIAPSPNLPNMSSIYLYPSLCLFEGTNVSIGRGTKKPFQQFGAPYLQSDYSFTPEPMFGAKHPKHEDVTCFGYDLELFGREYVRSYSKLYLYWLVASYDQCDDKATFFRTDGFFRLLTGDKSVRKKIEAGVKADDIWEAYQEEVLEWKLNVRKKYLIYDDF